MRRSTAAALGTLTGAALIIGVRLSVSTPVASAAAPEGGRAPTNNPPARLQQIILPVPTVPFDLPGLRVAVRYLPAEQASRVGGDWYHAAASDDGRTVLAVGDVAGHGIHAATTMAQLRHALAALA